MHSHPTKKPNWFRARIKAIQTAIAYENSLPESRERQMRLAYLRNGFEPDGFLQGSKSQYEFNIGSGLFRTIHQYANEFKSDFSNEPLTQVEVETFDTYFAIYPEHVCGVQKGGSGYSFPVTTIGTKEDIENTIKKYLGKEHIVLFANQIGSRTLKFSNLKNVEQYAEKFGLKLQRPHYRKLFNEQYTYEWDNKYEWENSKEFVPLIYSLEATETKTDLTPSPSPVERGTEQKTDNRNLTLIKLKAKAAKAKLLLMEL